MFVFSMSVYLFLLYRQVHHITFSSYIYSNCFLLCIFKVKNLRTDNFQQLKLKIIYQLSDQKFKKQQQIESGHVKGWHLRRDYCHSLCWRSLATTPKPWFRPHVLDQGSSLIGSFRFRNALRLCLNMNAHASVHFRAGRLFNFSWNLMICNYPS